MSPPDAERPGPYTPVADTDRHQAHRQPDDSAPVLTLFGLHPVGGLRHSDPVTSVAAARSVDAARQRDVILAQLHEHTDGLTADDLEPEVGTHRSVVASRLAQMRRDGLVQVVGVRANHAGRVVQLWRAT